MKIFNETANTVGTLIELLKQIPSDYSLSLSGMTAFAIVVDDDSKSILLDDVNFVEELMEDGTLKDIVSKKGE